MLRIPCYNREACRRSDTTCAKASEKNFLLSHMRSPFVINKLNVLYKRQQESWKSAGFSFINGCLKFLLLLAIVLKRHGTIRQAFFVEFFTRRYKFCPDIVIFFGSSLESRLFVGILMLWGHPSLLWGQAAWSYMLLKFILPVISILIIIFVHLKIVFIISYQLEKKKSTDWPTHAQIIQSGAGNKDIFKGGLITSSPFGDFEK